MITAILVNWKRTQHLPKIIASLPKVERIIVWNNGARLLIPGVTVINSPTNQYCYGRHLAAVETEYVITQDDDCIVRNWGQILAVSASCPDRVVANLKPWHLSTNQRRHWGPCHEVLLGWGSCFPKRVEERSLKKYTDTYGVTKTLIRESDRIFTIACQKEHIVLPAKTVDLEGSQDKEIALHCAEARSF